MRATDILSVVQDTDHLMDLCDDGATEFAIALNGGVRSSKNITWDGKRFYVFHSISGTHDRLTLQEFEKSFIHEAILAHCLYVLA